MLSLSKEHNTGYVIFGIAPKRLAKVTKLIRGKPHKFVIGFWEGAYEASCMMPYADFYSLAEEIGKGEECYLYLGYFNPKNGSRKASLVSFGSNEIQPIGQFSEVPEPPSNGEGFTFDPETGLFYAVKPDAN